MKKISLIKIVITTLFINILLMGCKKIEDVVDLTPTQLILQDNSLLSLTDYRNALRTVYARVRDTQSDLLSSLDRVSDDVKRGATTNGEGLNYLGFVFASIEPEIVSVWVNSYYAINLLNVVIEKLPSLNVSGANDVLLKNNILGEAYALRGFIHLDLTRFFCRSYLLYGGSELGVPYVKEPLVSTAQPSRNTLDECYNNILSDFNTATGLLTVSTLSTANHILITEQAVEALKARLFLYKGDWNQAITQSTLAIGLAPPLATAAVFPTMWNDTEALGEVIFKLKVIPVDGIGLFFGRRALDETAATITIRVSPVDNLLGLYGSDVRRNSYFGVIPAASLPAGIGDQNVVFKYRGPTSSRGMADFKVIRTAELYLIRAEAYARLGQKANAQIDMNAVRSQRITSGFVAEDYTGLTDAQVITRIMSERRREFAFEGHRTIDLRRNNIPVARGADCTLGCNVPVTDFRFQTFPIPQTEILANKNMVQNPGY